MCGIFGYVGPKNAVATVLQGLKRLEYRGYDSAGLAGFSDGQIVVCKEVGKVSRLEQLCEEHSIEVSHAIAHTRWATHGKPTAHNAHPHTDQENSLALVHNGIIENHEVLRNFLKEKGYSFKSDTDSEVIANLISYHYNDDLLQAIRLTLKEIKGSYAIALIHKDLPNTIVAIAHNSPLVLGIGASEMIIASDPAACAPFTKDVIYLEDQEIAFCRQDGLEILDTENASIQKEMIQIDFLEEEESKGSFDHYTLKEIFEQPQTVRQALLSRLSNEYGTAIFDEEGMDFEELFDVNRIVIVACGSSLHAGLHAAYMIEEIARIPVEVEISSEFRYKNPIVQQGTLALAISQSGETADTIAALTELKEKGAKVIAICNVLGSTIAREADAVIHLRAGPEIAVASTKAYTSQLIVLTLIALYLGRMHDMSKHEGRKVIQALEKIPEQIQAILDEKEHIRKIAKRVSSNDVFFFIGRRYQYPAALEGALKLKEISYINANAYPAGEMKHGPIALITSECPTLAFCQDELTFEKISSNLSEIKARDGLLIAVADLEQVSVASLADEVIWVPKTIDCLSPILSAVVSQLFAYFVALERGSDIDRPRNLAKSVTVE